MDLRLWGPCVGKLQEGPRSKKPASPLWDYRVDADVLFAGTSHLIHYPWPAREIVKSESIQKERHSLLLNWTLRELGSTVGSMHRKKSNFSSLLWPVFHTDCYYQHVRHPHVSICQSDILLSTVSVSKDSIETKSELGISWVSCLVESRFPCAVCGDVYLPKQLQWDTMVTVMWNNFIKMLKQIFPRNY